MKLKEVIADQLQEGTIAVDEAFEGNIQVGSNFEKFLKLQYKNCNKNKTENKGRSEKNQLLRVARLHGLIMQYMKGLLKKANIPSVIYDKHFQSRTEELSLATEIMRH